MFFAALLTGCAAPPAAPQPPSLLTLQRLVLDVATGEHQLLDADSHRAQGIATSNPGRLVRAAAPTSGVVSLGNVSIPLGLGANRAPAARQPAQSLPEESVP